MVEFIAGGLGTGFVVLSVVTGTGLGAGFVVSVVVVVVVACGALVN